MTKADEHETAGIAAYLAELVARRHAMSPEDNASPVLDEQIDTAVLDLLHSEARTLDDALALVWLASSTYAMDRHNGQPDLIRGLEITEGALANLDRFLLSIGAKRRFALSAEHQHEVN